MVKGCALTLNKICRSRVKGHIGPQQIFFFRAYVLSTYPYLAHTSHKQSFLVKGVQ